MSLIDLVLIYIDNCKEVSLEDILTEFKNNSLQIISSTLGRLTSRGYIKLNNRKNKSYLITKDGSDKINFVLNNLKVYQNRNEIDKKWHIIIFDIPEKKRKYRDALRNQISNSGYYKIQDSVWTSYHINKEFIDSITNLYALKNSITNLYSLQLNQEDEQELIKRMEINWDKINKEYDDFINKSKLALKKKKLGCIEAKNLVYQFAKILQKDPKFPDRLQSKNAFTNKAYESYLKIREYCYK
jgi:CRISPR-associated endonuclease Cas2